MGQKMSNVLSTHRAGNTMFYARPVTNPPDSYWNYEEEPMKCDTCRQVIEDGSLVADFGFNTLTHVCCADLSCEFELRTYDA